MSYTGFNFDTKGGKLKRNISGPTTNPLLLIGTAVDGPLNIPQQIRTSADVEALFGPAKYSGNYKDPDGVASNKYNGASLPLAIQEALMAGATNIWAVRATGTYAINATAFSSTLDLKSLYPGAIYNQVSMVVAAGSGSASGNVYVTLNQPTEKGGNFTLTMLTTDTVGDLIIRLKNDKRNKTIQINANTFAAKLSDALSTVTPATATLTGGTNETDAPGEALDGNKALYATRLTTADVGTFDMLIGDRFAFRFCALTGLYADDEVVAADPTKSIYWNYCGFLDSMSAHALPCFGTLGVTPLGITDTADMISYVNGSLLSETTGYFNAALKVIKFGPFMSNGAFRTTYDGQSVDLGARVSVCAGTDCIWTHPDIGQYIGSFHVWYAAKLSTLPPENSAIRQTINTAAGFVNKLPGKYVTMLASGIGASFDDDISGRGAYTVLEPIGSVPNAPRGIYDDCTAAFRDDYFRQAQLVNLCNSIHQDVRDQLTGFLGKPTSPTTLAAMKAAVQSVLDGYVASGGLKGAQGLGYEYDVYIDGSDDMLGIARVDMEIYPSTALRAIAQTIEVKRSAS